MDAHLETSSVNRGDYYYFLPESIFVEHITIRLILEMNQSSPEEFCLENSEQTCQIRNNISLLSDTGSIVSIGNSGLLKPDSIHP